MNFPTTPAILSFTVFGKPEPRGSKKSIPIMNRATGEPVRRPNGSIMIATTDDNPKSKGFMQDCAVACLVAMRQTGLAMTDAPVAFMAEFILSRPTSHFRTGKNSGLVRDSAPAYPDGRPDCGKLFRGVADALTGIFYRDDGQIVREFVGKRYGEPMRTEVSLFLMPATVAELEREDEVPEPDRQLSLMPG